MKRARTKHHGSVCLLLELSPNMCGARTWLTDDEKYTIYVEEQKKKVITSEQHEMFMSSFHAEEKAAGRERGREKREMGLDRSQPNKMACSKRKKAEQDPKSSINIIENCVVGFTFCTPDDTSITSAEKAYRTNSFNRTLEIRSA